jgi:hypothetical protein
MNKILNNHLCKSYFFDKFRARIPGEDIPGSLKQMDAKHS